MTTVNKPTLKPQSVGFYKYHDLVLGKGNFATVYRARHKVIGCEVALKVINTNAIKEEYLLKNLNREARILRGLHHPNIIRLYETVKSENLYCLSLEFIRGINMYQYMMNLGDVERISERLARIFFYQMLSGVEYMHRMHVIHRDLKLENILIEFGYVIKIVDFGLSNIYYPSYLPRTHCGSVEYAAPELFKSLSVYGTAVDVWSLGVILYAMVVGKMPFRFSRKNNKNEKEPDSPETARLRDLFVKRVAKGLMQDNWELMEGLSSECWEILHEMLQPDQFRRIRIEHAVTHSWITKDVHLKKRLPQSRKDLERKFHPEIINYLARKLNTSTSRIERHINVHPYDKISSMFYIMRDILVKEVLHPPKEFESSFLYRFECWRQNRSSLYPMKQNSDLCEGEVCEGYDHSNEKSEEVSPKSLTFSNQVSDESKIPSTSSMDRKDQGVQALSPRLEKINSLKLPEKSPMKINRQFVTLENIDIDSNARDESKKVSHIPYRSYKSGRPKTIEFSRSKDKNINKPSDMKHAFESDYLDEKLHENNPPTSRFHKEKIIEFESQKSPSECRKINEENSLISNLVKAKKQPISEIPTKSKSLESKLILSSSIGERRNYLEKIQAKSSTLSNGITSVKKSKPYGTKIVSRRPGKDCNNLEFVTRQTEGKRISLLPRTYQPIDDLKKKKEGTAITSESSGRIPVRSNRYDLPAPFSKPVSIGRQIFLNKITDAGRNSLCSGDTKERDGQTMFPGIQKIVL